MLFIIIVKNMFSSYFNVIIIIISAYSFHHSSLINHQTSIINHQSSIINHQSSSRRFPVGHSDASEALSPKPAQHALLPRSGPPRKALRSLLLKKNRIYFAFGARFCRSGSVSACLGQPRGRFWRPKRLYFRGVSPRTRVSC